MTHQHSKSQTSVAKTLFNLLHEGNDPEGVDVVRHYTIGCPRFQMKKAAPIGVQPNTERPQSPCGVVSLFSAAREQM